MKTTISKTAASVKPIKPEIPSQPPYTLAQIMANFDTMRDVSDLNWCRQLAASVIERGIDAVPVAFSDHKVAFDKITAQRDELLTALQRLLRANESDVEQCPAMDVKTAFETKAKLTSGKRLNRC